MLLYSETSKDVQLAKAHTCLRYIILIVSPLEAAGTKCYSLVYTTGKNKGRVRRRSETQNRCLDNTFKIVYSGAIEQIRYGL